MADPAHAIVVSRDGDDLDLANNDTHQLVVWNPPALEWRKAAVAGRYQAGERLVNAVPDTATIGGVIRCMGDTWDDVDDAVAEMYLALQQFEYTVTVTFAAVSETYTECQPAMIRPATGQRTSGEVRSCFADFEIQIRCTPNIAVEVGS